jgi:hypothetical protein
MDHWREVLPEAVMIEVVYEDLVADLEGQARILMDHCGLDWDPGRVERHSGQHQPIYSSSVGRWRRYQPWLGPLIEALGPELTQP